MARYVTAMDIVDQLHARPDAVSHAAAAEIMRLRAENTKLALTIRFNERDAK